MLEIIPCPQGGAPAEIHQRLWLDSTDGPIQPLQTGCLSKHWLTLRAETVDQQWPATRSQLRDRAELLGPGAAGGARQHGGRAGR
jgi:hypothetical protein